MSEVKKPDASAEDLGKVGNAVVTGATAITVGLIIAVPVMAFVVLVIMVVKALF